MRDRDGNHHCSWCGETLSGFKRTATANIRSYCNLTCRDEYRKDVDRERSKSRHSLRIRPARQEART